MGYAPIPPFVSDIVIAPAINAKIKASVGFVPTVRSFFTTLIANTELFLELLRQTSYDAELYHQRNSDSDKIRFKNEEDVCTGYERYLVE